MQTKHKLKVKNGAGALTMLYITRQSAALCSSTQHSLSIELSRKKGTEVS